MLGAINPAQIEVKSPFIALVGEFSHRAAGIRSTSMELMFSGMPDAGRFVVAFILVLGLIGAGALLWRRFGAGPLSPMGPRGRQPRLAVIDAASVDARRRLILVKRDNVEHLLMIGGPTDIVVESNIGRVVPMAVSRDPRPIPDNSRHPAPTDGPDWSLPLEPVAARPVRANGDLDVPAEPPPRAAREAMVDSIPSPRTAREAMVDSMRAVRPPGPVSRRSAAADLDTPAEQEIAAPALTPSPASGETSDRSPPLAEPRRAPSPPEAPRPQPAPETTSQSGAATEAKRPATPTPRAVQSEENSLAEMAQRLEAALRRPTKPIETATPPLTAPRPPRPESPAARKPHLDAVNAGKGSTRLPEQPASPPP